MKAAGKLNGLYGIRLDSGDLSYLSKKARKLLDEAGFTQASICASSDLDEYLIDSLKTQGAKINSWGVGTNLITSKDCPAFGGVYKLAAIKKDGEFVPKIKLSENQWKITNPGNKTVYRVYEKESGKIKADVIALVGEKFSESNPLLLFDPMATWKKTYLKPNTYILRELLVPVFLEGSCVYESPLVMDIKAYCSKELDTLWDETRRLINPHDVYVDLSSELFRMKSTLLDTYNGNISE
jgi:nicotinate phosphoribosyltransferase